MHKTVKICDFWSKMTFRLFISRNRCSSQLKHFQQHPTRRFSTETKISSNKRRNEQKIQRSQTVCHNRKIRRNELRKIQKFEFIQPSYQRRISKTQPEIFRGTTYRRIRKKFIQKLHLLPRTNTCTNVSIHLNNNGCKLLIFGANSRSPL